MRVINYESVAQGAFPTSIQTLPKIGARMRESCERFCRSSSVFIPFCDLSYFSEGPRTAVYLNLMSVGTAHFGKRRPQGELRLGRTVAKQKKEVSPKGMDSCG